MNFHLSLLCCPKYYASRNDGFTSRILPRRRRQRSRRDFFFDIASAIFVIIGVDDGVRESESNMQQHLLYAYDVLIFHDLFSLSLA